MGDLSQGNPAEELAAFFASRPTAKEIARFRLEVSSFPGCDYSVAGSQRDLRSGSHTGRVLQCDALILEERPRGVGAFGAGRGNTPRMADQHRDCVQWG